MQPVWPALPELDRGGMQSITAPVFRQRNIAVRIFRSHGARGQFQFAAIAHYGALWRCGGADPASERAGVEIGSRLAPGGFRDVSGDTYLPLNSVQ